MKKISILRNIKKGPEMIDVFEYYDMLPLSQMKTELQELREEGQSKLADSIEKRWFK